MDAYSTCATYGPNLTTVDKRVIKTSTVLKYIKTLTVVEAAPKVTANVAPVDAAGAKVG